MLKQHYQNLAIDKTTIERKIANVAEGLPKQVSRRLRSVENYGNVIEIANYVMAMKLDQAISNYSESLEIKISAR